MRRRVRRLVLAGVDHQDLTEATVGWNLRRRRALPKVVYALCSSGFLCGHVKAGIRYAYMPGIVGMGTMPGVRAIPSAIAKNM